MSTTARAAAARRPGIVSDADGHDAAAGESLRPDQLQPRWKWWYGPAAFGVGHALILALLFAIGAVLSAVGARHVRLIGLGELVVVGTLAATAFLFARRSGRVRLSDFGFRRTGARAAVGWTALAFVSYAIAAGIYLSSVHTHLHATPRAVHGILPAAAIVVSLIVLAPLGEEFFYRGFLYKALRLRLSAFWATAIAGAVFSAMHFVVGGRPPVDLPPLAFAGFALCLLYERTGSLWPGIAMHMTMNGTAAMSSVAGTPAPWWIAVAVVAALFLLAPWRMIGGGSGARRDTAKPRPAESRRAAAPAGTHTRAGAA